MLIFGVAALLNLGKVFRNWQLFSSPFGPSAESEIAVNEALSVGTTISNIVRNLANEFATPFESWNQILLNAVTRVHEWIGLDVSYPPITFRPFHVSSQATFEDIAGNPLHMLLVLSAILIFVFHRSLRRHKGLVTYGVLLSMAFVLFCCVLKWQPWLTRLHLSFFVLAAPLVGMAAASIRFSKITALLMGILILLSPYWVIFNEIRPWVGPMSIFKTERYEQYYNAYSGNKKPFELAAQGIRQAGHKRIGLNFLENDREYTLWILTESLKDPEMEIRHVDVTNLSKAINWPDYDPDIILCSHMCAGRDESTLRKYVKTLWPA